MGYHMDDRAMGLDDLQKRLETTDLIPSYQPLLEGIDGKMASLERAGCTSVAALRARLKSKTSLASLARDAGVDADYLVLLRRAVEGFFPKPQPLRAFAWLDGEALAKLEKAGVKDTEQLHRAAAAGPAALAEKSGLRVKDLCEWIAVADLSRVQWVSPTFARVLVTAGFDSAAKVASATAEALWDGVVRANESARFYRGKVGMRDMRRLIAAAAYVS